MSFAQLYRERYAETLRPAHKGEVHTVMITALRNHEDRWNGNGWAFDFEDAEGRVGSLDCAYVKTMADGSTKPMAWLLPRQLDTILKRIPAAEEYIVDPNAPFSETRIRPDASNLVRGAIVEVKCGYLGADKERDGRVYKGRVSWDLVGFLHWHQPDGPDAQQDADANATTGDRSTPEGGGYGAYMASAPYGRHPGQEPGAVPYSDDADIPF